MFSTVALPPQELSYVVPSGAKPGDIIPIQGPNGPLHVPVPSGKYAGDQCVFMFAPRDSQLQVTVPDGAKVGDSIPVHANGMEPMAVNVPPDLAPGDTFTVSKPVVMVQVPHGARAGDQVAFHAPDGRPLVAVVPGGFPVGTWFSANV